MKRAFIMTADCHLASAMVALDTQDVLGIGDRITTTRLLDLGYAAQIAQGEEGTVDYVDAYTGLVEILMDLPHRGLHAWHNHMWLEPFGTEDIIDGIICVSRIISQLQRVA